MKPDKMVIKDDQNDSEYWIATLYGIDFKLREGSVEGKMPLKEISDKNNFTFEEMKDILKKYNLLGEDENISDKRCTVRSYLPERTEDYSEINYPFFVLSNVLTPKKGTALKDNDFEPSCIWGHEQFIVDLVKKAPVKLRCKLDL